MPAGITVFVGAQSATVQVETAVGLRQLQLYYASIGGDPALTDAQKLQVIARRLGKIVADGAEDAKRRGYELQAQQDNAADSLGEPLGGA